MIYKFYKNKLFWISFVAWSISMYTVYTILDLSEKEKTYENSKEDKIYLISYYSIVKLLSPILFSISLYYPNFYNFALGFYFSYYIVHLNFTSLLYKIHHIISIIAIILYNFYPIKNGLFYTTLIDISGAVFNIYYYNDTNRGLFILWSIFHCLRSTYFLTYTYISIRYMHMLIAPSYIMINLMNLYGFYLMATYKKKIL